MLEFDERSAAVKSTEAQLKAAEGVIARERATIESEAAEAAAALAASEAERQAIIPALGRPALDLFERVMKVRQGIAVATAVNGHCSICHVRLRPQVYNTIITNDAIVQCDSCNRVLWFDGTRQRSAEGQAALDAAHARQTEHERPTP
jgi:uncharacterized protein